MKITAANTAKFTALLAETADQIAEATAGLPEALLNEPPTEQEWSTAEILTHLHACADMWGYSILAMLAQDNPTLSLQHPRDWLKIAGYAAPSFKASLQSFQRKRGELLRVLGSLSAEAWTRTAEIDGRTYTVFSQTRRMALHEAAHRADIESLCEALWEKMTPWWLYVVRCGDDTLYTGITTDVARRFRQHEAGRGAKYLRGRGPLTLVFAEQVGRRGTALKLERALKKRSRASKERLILGKISLKDL